MCGPNTSQLFGMSASAAGGILQTAGTFANVRATRRTAKANAAYSEEQARDAERRGETAVQTHQRKVARLKGTQRANLAANGFDLNSGSPLDILRSTDVMAEQDAETIRENTRREATGFRTQGANYRTVADSANPWLAAGASALGSAGVVADKWYQYKNVGGKKK